MKLIDMLAGTPSDDQMDRPSGVKLMVEPSAGLLEIIDDFRKNGGGTRESALLACAALGAVSKKVVGGFFAALTGGGDSKPRSSPRSPVDDLEARAADMRAKELLLAKALAQKDVLKEALEACEEVVKETLERDPDSPTPEYADAAISCANAMRDLQRRVVADVDEAFKNGPGAPLVDFKRVVGSAAQRECHYIDLNGHDCRKEFTREIDWPKWCAACVCKHALPEIWGA